MPVCCGCSGLNVVPMGRRGRFGCVTLLAGAGAFVNAALGLQGWLWCVTFAWNTWARLWTLRLVCRDGCGVCYVCVEYVDAFVDTAPGLPG